MSKKVFIIGNGFDLDLGMNTRYSDFAISDKWPLVVSHSNTLSKHLQDKAHLEKWFDLEKELLSYAGLRGKTKVQWYKNIADTNKKYFNSLVSSLTEYIKEEEKKPINKDSIAAKVFRAIIENGAFSSIYSFNYTDLHEIARKLGITQKFNYEHVHGSIKNDNIILGVEDKSDLIAGYQFMYKTYSPHYESHPIQYDLLEADEVVFFGHSLGHNDYHYFQMFFLMQCQENMNRKDGKRITIFTYDDASRIQILEQLRSMNDRKMDLLFNLNQLQVICTKDGESMRFRRFLEELKERGEGLNNFVLNQLLG